MVTNRYISAIVLAAGQSKRAGPVNKLLNPVKGRAMVHVVVDTLVTSPISSIVVVTGFEAREIVDTLFDCPVAFAHNADFEQGMGTSIAKGVAALPGAAEGVVVCLGDMPNIKSTTISQLMENMEDGIICVPVKDGRQGNPVLFSAKYFPNLKELGDDRGGKQIIDANLENVREVPVNDDGIFIDHDRVD
jgi:molybdenum cofactor cytidylyltransferase